jgi:hypothetical protein
MTKTPEQMAEEYAWKHYGYSAINHQLDFLAGYQAAMNSSNNSNGWISVKERLPEEGLEVLIFGKILNDISKVLGVRARFQGDQKSKYTWESEDIHIYTQYDVTHWMPLPKPPEEK